MSGKPKIPVLVTGFGPFGIHKVNISWEIAKILKTLNFEADNIDLIIQEIPVVYSVVSQEVPSLWKKYKPQLVIHMGVTSIGSDMTLEMVANKNGYKKADTQGKLPEHGSANGVKDVLRTNLNVQDVCEYLTNSVESEVPIHVSLNAGRYVCEFTYYTSLNVDHTRTVFVHVPDFDKGYTVLQIANVVKMIIFQLLKQIKLSSINYKEEGESTAKTE